MKRTIAQTMWKCYANSYKCTNRLNATQAVITANAVNYSLILLIVYLGDYSSTAAWAAAKRAIGTRKGEQLT